ncbi:techylectin-5A [Trichonephila clavata]|uniref:Techylectin-5A n=1 Tax=Trichonephila clavata TaxID=2740835 RepID=A0A8X6JFK8_TRICU|nr:techylectin-5A [Trichonephila clavata]
MRDHQRAPAAASGVAFLLGFKSRKNFCLFKIKEFHSRSKNDEMHSYLTECEKKEMIQVYLDIAMNNLKDIKEHHALIFNGLEDQSENLTTHLFSLVPLKDKHTQLVTEIGKQHKPTDCTEILEILQSKSGIYTIWPTAREKELEVFCDMDTDGGGWIVIQRRGNFSKQEDFYLDWESYKKGFGNITKDFWLGMSS